MILSTFVSVKIVPQNIKKYTKKYTDIKVNDIINIDIKDLPFGSHEKIKVSCDNCYDEKEVYYFSYNKIFKKHNRYICIKCTDIERKKTILEKYGVAHTLSIREIRDNIKKTMNEKYGVDYPAQNKEILDKIQTTNLEKYGTKYPSQNKEILYKIQTTNLEKYGNISSFSDKEVRKKIKRTMNIKYGVDFTFQDKDLHKMSVEKTKKTKIKNIIKNNIEIISIDYEKMEYKCYCKNCKNIYFINTHLFNYRKHFYKTEVCIHCNKIGKKYSNSEKKLVHFIQENYNSEIILNSRKIISPFELDIYLPELKIAFEFNGLFWHSEINKDINYHNNKTDLCIEKNIQLIHIYEDDWKYKEYIIKSLILKKMNIIKNNIPIKNTKIIEIIDYNSIKDFLKNNSIENNLYSDLNIGLFHNNILVSIMCFEKLEDNNYKLINFCDKLNIDIIGSMSKLFNYFIKKYNPNKIITYVDRSYNDYKDYEAVGFYLNNIINPSYSYIINNIRQYDIKLIKERLIKENLNINKSEYELLLDNKIYKIYNSGYYELIYSN